METPANSAEVAAFLQRMQERIEELQTALQHQQERSQLQQQQLVHELQQRQQNVRGLAPALRPAKPDTYDGTKAGNKAEVWLFQMAEYFNACGGVGEGERVSFAGSMLRGHASTWWRLRRTRAALGEIPEITSWQQFCTELKAEFALVNAVKHARDSLARLEQRTSVQTYVHDFRELALQIPDLSEAEKLDRFLRGLKPRLQRELAIRDPRTMDEAANMAERIDTVDFAWRVRHEPTPMELGTAETLCADAVRFNNKDEKMGGKIHFRPKKNDDRIKTSNMEKERLRRQGLCFTCKKHGHMARNWPDKATSLN